MVGFCDISSSEINNEIWWCPTIGVVPSLTYLNYSAHTPGGYSTTLGHSCDDCHAYVLNVTNKLNVTREVDYYFANATCLANRSWSWMPNLDCHRT